MEFKHLVFFLVLFLGVPVGVLLAYSNRLFEKATWIAVVAFGFLGNSISINFFSFETYRGTSRGYEITLVDLAALTLFLVMALKQGSKMTFRVPGIGLYLIYLIFSLLSISNAENSFYSYAEVLKMIRMCFYFIVVFNYLDWRKEFTSMLFALAVVIALTFLVVLKQKYKNGIYQPPGFFPHQNSMALYMELLGPVFFAGWMNLKLSSRKMLLFGLAFLFSAGCAFLSYSRGAFLFFPVACGIVGVFSLFYHFEPRQVRILALLAVVGAFGVLLMLPNIIRRFESAPEASKNTRINLAIAARNMANDKFFGVGLNNWGIKINPPYTYSEHRIGGRYTDDFKDGIVETIYMLVAAECGWIGLASLLLMFAYFGILALRMTIAYAQTPLFYLPLGLMGGLAADYGHSILEWVLKQTPNFYILILAFGILSVLLHWKKEEKKRKKTAGGMARKKKTLSRSPRRETPEIQPLPDSADHQSVTIRCTQSGQESGLPNRSDTIQTV